MGEDDTKEQPREKAARKPRRGNLEIVPPPVRAKKPKKRKKAPKRATVKKAVKVEGQPQAGAKGPAAPNSPPPKAPTRRIVSPARPPEAGFSPPAFDVPRPSRGIHSPQFFAFAMALGAGKTVREAAAEARYSETHAFKLWRKPEVKDLMAEIQSSRIEHAGRTMAELRGLALVRAVAMIRDPKTPPAVAASLIRTVFDRSGFSPQHRLQIDATVKTAPMAAMTADELLADLRLEYARAGLPAEEIEAKLIEARAMLPDDSR